MQRNLNSGSGIPLKCWEPDLLAFLNWQVHRKEVVEMQLKISRKGGDKQLRDWTSITEPEERKL